MRTDRSTNTIFFPGILVEIGPIPKTKYANSCMWAICDFASHHITWCQPIPIFFLSSKKVPKKGRGGWWGVGGVVGGPPMRGGDLIMWSEDNERPKKLIGEGTNTQTNTHRRILQLYKKNQPRGRFLKNAGSMSATGSQGLFLIPVNIYYIEQIWAGQVGKLVQNHPNISNILIEQGEAKLN